MNKIEFYNDEELIDMLIEAVITTDIPSESNLIAALKEELLFRLTHRRELLKVLK